MKKTILFLYLCLMSFFGQGNVLRLGYINSEYIFTQIPEYQQAKEKLEFLSNQWQQDLKKMWEQIEAFKQSYETEKVFLTKTLREEREEVITDKERKAQDYQQQKFGLEGELIKRQQSLLAPIEKLLIETVQKIIQEEKYHFIFDLAQSNGIFASGDKNDKLNLSDYVLRKMGYSYQKK